MCHRNRTHTYRKDNRSASFIPDCMCWHCWECRPRLRRKWIGHATRVLETCGRYTGVVVVPVEYWDTFSRRLRNHGILHFKVRLGTPQYGIVIGSPVPIEDLPFSAEAMTADKAIKRFTGWVNSVQDGRGGNPVSSSRAWSLPEHKPGGWQKIAVGPTAAQVRELAAAVDVHFSERFLAGTDMIVCRGETAAMDALCTALAELNPKIHAFEGKSELNNVSAAVVTDSDDYFPWGYEPDESAIPYTVGAVT